MKLAWFTDMHLDHITRDPLGQFDGRFNLDKADSVSVFCKKIVKQYNPDAIMIGGDISNAELILDHLNLLSLSFGKKVYFVLGNHDYYGSSLDNVDERVKAFVKGKRKLTWLDAANPIKLTENTALVGSSLWTDGKAGNWRTSNVWLNDYGMIADLRSSPYDTARLEKKLEYHAGQLTRVLVKKLKRALKKYNNIIMLTHVAPFWEGSFFDGKVQDDNWAPHFVCTVAGEQIREVMEKYPDKHLTIYSGHTHGSGEKQIADNIFVKNGRATYGKLELQEVIEVG